MGSCYGQSVGWDIGNDMPQLNQMLGEEHFEALGLLWNR